MCASFDSTLPESQMRPLIEAHEAMITSTPSSPTTREAVLVDVPPGHWRA